CVPARSSCLAADRACATWPPPRRATAERRPAGRVSKSPRAQPIARPEAAFLDPRHDAAHGTPDPGQAEAADEGPARSNAPEAHLSAEHRAHHRLKVADPVGEPGIDPALAHPDLAREQI